MTDLMDRPAHRAEPPPAEKQSRGRRVTFWVGVGLILAGVGVLLWVLWLIYGTNWISKRHHDELVEQITSGEVEGVVIRIPSFGDDYAIPVLEGITLDVLRFGFGHFENSADPGQVGNYAVAGHRVSNGEPLLRMPELEAGDQVVVETSNRIFTYELIMRPRDLIVDHTASWVVDPLPKNPEPGGIQPEQVAGQRLITLVTCRDWFHEDDRMIAFGKLVSAKQRPVLPSDTA